jgi:hypothetical protein
LEKAPASSNAARCASRGVGSLFSSASGSDEENRGGGKKAEETLHFFALVEIP